MLDLIIGGLLAGTMLAQPERAPFAPPVLSQSALDEHGIDAEYRRPIDAKGFAPEWTARVELGAVRIRIEQQPERRIPLLTPYKCVVVACEGVMIEQAVAHRHHGVSIIKKPCMISGSGRTYPYRVTVSVLQSAEDAQGVNYKGCGWPAI